MSMKPEYKEKIIRALVAFMLVTVSVVGSMVMDAITEVGEVPIDVSPIVTPEPIIALGTTHFTNISAEDVTATDDLVVTDDTTLTDDLAVGGDLTLTGALTLGGLTYNSFTNLTVSVAGQVLTPTYTVYALDTSGAISMTLAASASEGQFLILIGDDANTVTVNDTNLRSHDGAALSIGQYDIALLVYQDAEWIQLVELANQ